jgi:hypothetical protein
MAIEKFTINVSDALLADLRRRLDATHWPDELENSAARARRARLQYPALDCHAPGAATLPPWSNPAFSHRISENSSVHCAQ